ncbi:hypothetical protein, partial [Veillonella montpellierensis]|uniref:hypothetical protein n=1 Tax=Veillonella montpellierensis TaxID=187328 RepID=UPI00057103D8
MPDEMKTVANNGIYQKDYSVAGTIEGGPAPKGIWDTVKDTVSSIGDSVERINTTLADPNANIMDKLTTVTGELGIHDSLQKFSRYTDMYTMSRANDNNLAGYLYASIYAKPNYDAVKRDKAIEIGSKLHISPDVILTASEDGFARAIDISNQMDRGKTYEEVTREYPELLHLRYDSLASAEKTFDDVQNVNKTKGVFDSIQQSLWAMNDQLLLGYAGYKLAETTDEADRQTILQEIDRLQNNLQQYRTTDVADLGSKIVGDSVAQLYMMGVQAFKGSNRAVQGMGVGATLGAVSGSALGGVGAAPGAVAGGITGLTYGAQVGMAEQMYQTSFGKKYIDLIQKKDANGRNVYSHDEAYSMAQKFAAIDTGIEFFAMRVGAKAVVKATPASRMVVQALTTGVDTTVSAINKGMGAIVGQAVKRGVKAGIPELVEEGLQDVNEKVQHNLFRKANDPEGSYSVGDIASGALGAMVQAAPSVIGIAGLGSIAGGLRARHDLRKWQRLTPEEQTALLQEEQNRNAHTLMTNIRNDARTNKIAQENPEIYGQLVQTYAQKVQVPTAYINVHEMVETPEGQQAIRELVNAGIVSNERVAKSIEAETPIEVPLGQFAQKATDLSDNAMEAIKNTTYYTEGGRSMRRIQKEKESYEQARQDVHEELKNHKANVKRDIINEYVPDASAYQKEILNDVLDD